MCSVLSPTYFSGKSKGTRFEGLTEERGGDLDGIRVIGSLAAHPEKDATTGQIVDVEAQEAEWLLSTLEALSEFYYFDH